MIRYAMELEQDVTTANLSHAEYVAKLLHCECERRDEEALKRRLQQANFRYADACIARVDWNADRQINRSLLDTLASNDYIRFHHELRSSLRNFESQNEYGYKPCIKRRFQNAETLQSRNQKNSS